MDARAPQAPVRPDLTLPEPEARALRAAYAAAGTILEYGSGGSTVMAAEMPGKTVFAVESDADWAAMMREWFGAHPPAAGSRVEVLWSDIGPTRDWGHPRSHHGWRRYAQYPLAVWDLADLPPPDVVFVDGRFRAGCALAAAFRTRRPVSVWIDDYAARKSYRAVEEFLGPPRMVGRMAAFEIAPQPVPVDRLLRIIELMTQP